MFLYLNISLFVCVPHSLPSSLILILRRLRMPDYALWSPLNSISSVLLVSFLSSLFSPSTEPHTLCSFLSKVFPRPQDNAFFFAFTVFALSCPHYGELLFQKVFPLASLTQVFSRFSTWSSSLPTCSQLAGSSLPLVSHLHNWLWVILKYVFLVLMSLSF